MKKDVWAHHKPQVISEELAAETLSATWPEAPVIASIRVGSRVWFEAARQPFDVQARDENWIIMTRPFAARKTVLYTIMDVRRGMRGPDDLVFSFGYETRADCEENLRRLADGKMRLSYRREIPTNIRKVSV